MSSSTPCAACKLLRRKCTTGCVFAPYFPPDQPAKFGNVHRVFGASNVTKLLTDLPPALREDAVKSLAYEAEARLHDPVYGCVAYISVLQIKNKQIRDSLEAARKELACYIGPAAFQPLLPAAAGGPVGFVGPPYQTGQFGVDGTKFGVSLPQQQHVVDAQQMAAAVEAAREREMMLRQAAAYGQGGGATVAVAAPAEAYDGASFLMPGESSQLVQPHAGGSVEGSGTVVPPA